MPGDANYPTDIGATSGLLRYEKQGHGAPDHLRFAKHVPFTDIAKLVIRMYVPGTSKKLANTIMVNGLQCKTVNIGHLQLKVRSLTLL